MSAKDEKRFQSSNKCWICNKIFDVEDQRNHCHLTVNNEIIFFNRVLRNRKNQREEKEKKNEKKWRKSRTLF